MFATLAPRFLAACIGVLEVLTLRRLVFSIGNFLD